MFAGLITIPLGYLLGSIPSAVIVARLIGKVNLCNEGDGHISATAAYRRAGLAAFIIAICMDVGKAMLSVFLAGLITQSQWIILAAGLATVVGHCWSIFIKFRGGLGATVICGVLAGMAIWDFLISAVIVLIFFLITRKSTVGTILIIVVMSIILFINKADLLTVFYPYSLLMVQFLKRFQIRKATPVSDYTNEICKDLKRTK